MIYAIRAVGTEFIKFGYTTGDKLGRRIETLQTGCPYPLEVLAECQGDHRAERAIHLRLFRAKAHFRGEWFKDCEEVQRIIQEMRAEAVAKDESPSDVLKIWNCAVRRKAIVDVAQRKPGEWKDQPKRQPRAKLEPYIPLEPAERANERFERIKRLANERAARKAAKRSQETA